MENFSDELKHYWETQMFYQTEEFETWRLAEAISGYYDSISPDGNASSSMASKNIVSERNRRKKLNNRLFALRAVVPNISKSLSSTVEEKAKWIFNSFILVIAFSTVQRHHQFGFFYIPKTLPWSYSFVPTTSSSNDGASCMIAYLQEIAYFPIFLYSFAGDCIFA